MRISLETGLVTRSDMIEAHLEAEERTLLVELLEKINHERIDDIRIRASIR